ALGVAFRSAKEAQPDSAARYFGGEKGGTDKLMTWTRAPEWWAAGGGRGGGDGNPKSGDFGYGDPKSGEMWAQNRMCAGDDVVLHARPFQRRRPHSIHKHPIANIISQG